VLNSPSTVKPRLAVFCVLEDEANQFLGLSRNGQTPTGADVRLLVWLFRADDRRPIPNFSFGMLYEDRPP
jgi:hypothetical protein